MTPEMNDKIATQTAEFKEAAYRSAYLMLNVPPEHRAEASRLFVDAILGAAGCQSAGIASKLGEAIIGKAP